MAGGRDVPGSSLLLLLLLLLRGRGRHGQELDKVRTHAGEVWLRGAQRCVVCKWEM